jgi:hypothetical protein
MCDLEISMFVIRFADTIKNVVPISTWIPWKPVAMKNVDPYVESLIENSASLYSIYCKHEKYTPKMIVMMILFTAFFILLSIAA